LSGGGRLRLEAQRQGREITIGIFGEPGGENALEIEEPDSSSSPFGMAPGDLEVQLRAVASLLAPIGGSIDEDVSLDGARTLVRMRTR
jgi:hypothetical protein